MLGNSCVNIPRSVPCTVYSLCPRQLILQDLWKLCFCLQTRSKNPNSMQLSSACFKKQQQQETEVLLNDFRMHTHLSGCRGLLLDLPAVHNSGKKRIHSCSDETTRLSRSRSLFAWLTAVPSSLYHLPTRPVVLARNSQRRVHNCHSLHIPHSLVRSPVRSLAHNPVPIPRSCSTDCSSVGCSIGCCSHHLQEETAWAKISGNEAFVWNQCSGNDFLQTFQVRQCNVLTTKQSIGLCAWFWKSQSLLTFLVLPLTPWWVSFPALKSAASHVELSADRTHL